MPRAPGGAGDPGIGPNRLRIGHVYGLYAVEDRGSPNVTDGEPGIPPGATAPRPPRPPRPAGAGHVARTRSGGLTPPSLQYRLFWGWCQFFLMPSCT